MYDVCLYDISAESIFVVLIVFLFFRDQEQIWVADPAALMFLSLPALRQHPGICPVRTSIRMTKIYGKVKYDLTVDIIQVILTLSFTCTYC